MTQAGPRARRLRARRPPPRVKPPGPAYRAAVRLIRVALLATLLLGLVIWAVAWTYRAPQVDGQSPVVVHDYHGPGCAGWHVVERYLAAWGEEGVGLMAPWL